MSLRPVPPWPVIHGRLAVIFPEGAPNRAHAIWEIAARTIFVMLYAGAVEGENQWLRPDQVTRMTDEQAALTDEDARVAWAKASIIGGKGEIAGRWYASNTRESGGFCLVAHLKRRWRLAARPDRTLLIRAGR